MIERRRMGRNPEGCQRRGRKVSTGETAPRSRMGRDPDGASRPGVSAPAAPRRRWGACCPKRRAPHGSTILTRLAIPRLKCRPASSKASLQREEHRAVAPGGFGAACSERDDAMFRPRA